MDADPRESDVQQFASFLTKRGRQNAARKVVGPARRCFHLDVLTFWSRKAAAHRVASRSVQELFATIQQVKFDQEQADHRQVANATVPKVYVICHSFGVESRIFRASGSDLSALEGFIRELHEECKNIDSKRAAAPFR